jgi:hypothetical protein
MSTHRKIEWSLFILGLIGTSLSLWLGASVIQISLLGIGTLFAGLHAFKLYDGHKSNHVVVATSLMLVAYTGYLLLTDIQDMALDDDWVAGGVIGTILSALSLRLRRDFHKASPAITAPSGSQ